MDDTISVEQPVVDSGRAAVTAVDASQSVTTGRERPTAAGCPTRVALSGDIGPRSRRCP